MLVPAALVALLAISTPGVLPRPSAAPAFDGEAAAALSAELSSTHPLRIPGTPEAALAAGWYRQTMASLGLPTEEHVWRENLPGLGEVELRNVVTVVRGHSPAEIVVVAHRDNTQRGAAGDNPSGTAALIELARPYGSLGAVRPPVPQRTLVLVSTDGGAWGGAGAVRVATQAAREGRVVAVVALHGLARPGRPRIATGAGAAAAPARALVSTASALLEEHVGLAPELPSTVEQLVGLGVPFAAGEQAPFLARGIPALTVSGGGIRAGEAGDPRRRTEALGRLGRATEALLGSLDASPRDAFGTSDTLFLDGRVLSGWALRLLLVVAVAPFAVGVADLLARARRRRLPLRPAARALRQRLFVLLYGGALLWLAAATGTLPSGAPLPFPPAAARSSPAALLLLGGAFLAGWAVARRRLVRLVTPTPEETLAGYTVALAWLAGVAAVVALTRPYALVFVLPSLYAWLWLPRRPSRASSGILYLAGLTGPIVGIVVLARMLDIHALAAVRYLMELAGIGYLPATSVLIALAWLAAAAQIGALALGRYGPYAGGIEPAPPGVVRSAVGEAGRRLGIGRQASAR